MIRYQIKSKVSIFIKKYLHIKRKRIFKVETITVTYPATRKSLDWLKSMEKQQEQANMTTLMRKKTMKMFVNAAETIS